MPHSLVKHLTSWRVRRSAVPGADVAAAVSTVMRVTIGARHRMYRLVALAALSVLPSGRADADRLAATGGLSTLEGSGGGGLTPWALITGLGTDTQTGGTVYCTGVFPSDFSLRSCGIGLGFANRAELSLARLHFSLGHVVPNQTIDENVLGIKVRILGDAVVDQDRWWPQLAAGLQWKKNVDFAVVPQAVGAARSSGVDYYLAATKIMIDGPFSRTWVINGTARATSANQLGLLGFGGDRGSYHLTGEASIVAFVARTVAAGVEYRQKPSNLSAFREDDFSDVVLAFVPTPHLSVTGAYARLGSIAGQRRQNGAYLSLQAVF